MAQNPAKIMAIKIPERMGFLSAPDQTFLVGIETNLKDHAIRGIDLDHARGITSAAKRRISASNGWYCSMNVSIPTRWNATIRPATVS